MSTQPESTVPPSRGARRLASAALVILAALCLIQLSGLRHSTYSDHEIEQSIVDTWQVSAHVTMLLVGVELMSVVVTVTIALWRGNLRRQKVLIALFLLVASSCMAIHKHARLTQRTTALTGQHFGPFLGLL